MSLVLVGVRGSGKSVVGARLAERIGLEFVDLDDVIEREAGRTISEIFAEDGEPAFRELETRVLASLAEAANRILATGGGVVVAKANRRVLARLGRTLWLQVSADEAIARTAGSKHRPALTSLSPLEEARQVARDREPYYDEVAELVVSTDGRSVAEVCDELEQFWRSLATDNLR